jgi:transcription initiation factor TFIIIB Brf1 subunit/transcription initiation factor TFIIB
MSRRSNFNISRTACSHSDTIDDDREGTCVCTQCGLVLEQLFQQQQSFAVKDKIDFSNVFCFMKDVCANASIPNCLISYAFDYFKLLKSDMVLKGKRFKDEWLASYALYETLSRHKIPRTVNEMEYFTGVPMQTFWNIESCLSFNDTLNDSQDFVARFCTLLNISYLNAKCIESIVGKMKDVGEIRSSSIVAGVIYLYCRETACKINLKTICEVCAVSTGNMYKIIQKIEKEVVKLMLNL